MTVGFIGLGNMARAMIGGMIQTGRYPAETICGYDVYEQAMLDVSAQYPIRIASNNQEVAKISDVIILSVKPQYYAEVIQELRGQIRPEQIVISIAPGKSLSWLAEQFATPCKLIRCMPNTPALVGEGCTALCPGDLITEEDIKTAFNILECFGKAMQIPEKMMDAFVGISGSAPAYVFLFIEAMADEAVCQGMPRELAYQVASQAVLGSAKMVLETKKHPGVLKDMVCSPGGTTIEAVKVLEERGFRGIVMDAIDACIEKSKRM